MKPGPFTCLLLAAALALPAAAQPATLPLKADSATTLAMKRIADRYALTKARITSLLDPRMNPAPFPATLPNPFFRPGELPPAEDTPGAVDSTLLPAGPDESDAGTLAKFVATLKISGLSVLNGVSHLTLNQTLCKAGDLIPLESKGRTVYIQVLAITPTELTLGLNEEKQSIRLRR